MDTAATWDPISGGLCSNKEFLQHMDIANNPSMSWFNMHILGELGLNNQGRMAARNDRKVFVIFSSLLSSGIKLIFTLNLQAVYFSEITARI